MNPARDFRRTVGWALRLVPVLAMHASHPLVASEGSPLPRVRVEAEGHYLQLEDGRPFFWLGDTAWELIHRATVEECSYYLATRARQGFTVIQTVVLAELDGLHEPSAQGLRPLLDNDPTRPNDAYFDRVVAIVDEAATRGLYVALLPTWGDKLTAPWGAGPRIFRPDNLPAARAYARYLGARLRDRTNVVWMLGGDRPARFDPANPSAWPNHQAAAWGFAPDEDWRPIWREMAAGLEEGLGMPPLCLYHPQGGAWTTSAMLPDEPWLAIHGMQSGHGGGHDQPVWEWIARDFALSPPKPTLDLEPNYEDHPFNPWPRWNPATGYFRDHDVRKQCWRSVLAGGCGVTYGHHAVWQWVTPRHEVVNFADRDWRDALHRPAATQLRFLRELLESRPFFARVPDQAMILSGAGAGGDHVRAARDRDGTYAVVYLPRPEQRVTVDLAVLRSETVRAWWFDPRNGTGTLIGEIPAAAAEFVTPSYGPDWVLVFDDPSAGHGPPGLTRVARGGMLPELFAPENLLAWCIVPFDQRQRGPAERVAMLQRLGFTQYAWDWRPEHLQDLPEEIRLARAAGVRLRAIWLWIDATQDQIGTLSEGNRAVLAAVAEAKLPVEFWVGFHENYFADLDDAARLLKAVAMVSYLRDRTAEVGGSVALYNHGGWFGEPENQLRIIAALGGDSVGMVYNFHHGHDQLDRYAGFLPRIVPHLRAVNLNGMRPEGPKILPIGSGTREQEMLRQLLAAGYDGPLGVLGHVTDADVEEILRANLDGLRGLVLR